MTRLAASALAMFAISVPLTACGSDEGGQDSSGNAQDAAFVAGMVPHHESAVQMAELARSRAEHRQVKVLAAEIIAAQEEEIADMERLEESLPGSGPDHAGHMGSSGESMSAGDHMGMGDGMVGMHGMGGDVSELRNADPFDQTFLEMMIPHHEGAIRMAKRQLARGSNPELEAMSRQIIESQRQEIAQMRAWLRAWYGADR